LYQYLCCVTSVRVHVSSGCWIQGCVRQRLQLWLEAYTSLMLLQRGGGQRIASATCCSLGQCVRPVVRMACRSSNSFRLCVVGDVHGDFSPREDGVALQVAAGPELAAASLAELAAARDLVWLVSTSHGCANQG
jgi:hypothetical protein